MCAHIIVIGFQVHLFWPRQNVSFMFLSQEKFWPPCLFGALHLGHEAWTSSATACGSFTNVWLGDLKTKKPEK